ncbi:MAG: glutamyl-tRNA reductase [Planctomycetes bacterium]|nr:glutamyl-tRNA reductase [Planctomycetota bacterium]
MKILCVGVNHQSAPLDVRQRIAFDDAAVDRALAVLSARFDDAEFVILSTCNRVEVYSASRVAAPPTADDLVRSLAEFHGMEVIALMPMVYRLETEAAVRHLMMVTSSLDSMVVGESQIIGQVKAAFIRAVEAEATGKFLNRLFHRSFAAAKRVHGATEIGQRRTSVASVAVDFASQVFSGLAGKRVLVIGAGELAELAVVHLQSCGCGEVAIVNRSPERAEQLAARFTARAVAWERMDECLRDNDIVVASTSSPQPILDAERVAAVQASRGGREWMILDLAVPRDVDPAAGHVEGVFLYDQDRLAREVSQNLELRKRELDVASAIVDDEVAAFMDWFEVRDVGPLVEKLEARLHDIGDEEVERLLRRLGDDVSGATRNEIRLATHRIVHKLLHEPIEQLKNESRDGRGQMSMRVLRRLFHLGEGRDDE